jgi:hypothetical protein
MKIHKFIIIRSTYRFKIENAFKTIMAAKCKMAAGNHGIK